MATPGRGGGHVAPRGETSRPVPVMSYSCFQQVTTGDVKLLKFLEESKQPFRLLRIVTSRATSSR